jgi:hypothetical protein
MKGIIRILVLWFAFSGAVIGSTVPSTILINSSASNNSVMNTYERFFEKVYPCPTTGCWIWGAYTMRDGYGGFWYNGNVNLAHRISYMLYVGELPKGRSEHIAHKCDNKYCVNPDHLERISFSQNRRDAFKRLPHKSLLYSKETVDEARRLSATGKYSQSQIGKMLGVAASTVSCYVNKTRRNYDY